MVKKFKLKGALGKALGKTSIGRAVKSVGSLAGMRGAGAGRRRRHKKSARWYSREIARLKLKRRYERIQMRV